MSYVPQVTVQQVEAAMAVFDAKHRDTKEWAGWDKKANHRYAVRHNGQLYPVKWLIATAGPTTTNTFSGGTKTNKVLAELGFSIEVLNNCVTLSEPQPVLDAQRLTALQRRHAVRLGTVELMNNLEATLDILRDAGLDPQPTETEQAWICTEQLPDGRRNPVRYGTSALPLVARAVVKDKTNDDLSLLLAAVQAIAAESTPQGASL